MASLDTGFSGGCPVDIHLTDQRADEQRSGTFKIAHRIVMSRVDLGRPGLRGRG